MSDKKELPVSIKEEIEREAIKYTCSTREKDRKTDVTYGAELYAAKYLQEVQERFKDMQRVEDAERLLRQALIQLAGSNSQLVKSINEFLTTKPK